MIIQQLNKEQAIAVAKSEIWKKWNDEDIIRFQLFQDLLCMDFSKFHKAIEKVLNRPVYAHEFASKDQLIKEYLGKSSMPTFNEIVNLIPPEKHLIILDKKGKKNV